MRAAADAGCALYDALAEWWPVMSGPEEYAEEARHYGALLDAFGRAEQLLELGSGGGHNAFHLKRGRRMVLVDRAPAMLRQSRRLNPECGHLAGDMREVRLARRFDAVFVHDALDYLLTPLDLAAALGNARAHCRDGGAVLLAPDHFRETFRPGADHGGGDRGGRSLRYLEWSHEPPPGSCVYRVDYVLALREGVGEVRVIHDVHRCGLFPRSLWLEACRAAGLAPELRRIDLRDPEPLTTEVLLCRAV